MARTKRKANHLNPPETLKAGAAKQRIYRTGGYARLSVVDSGKPGADTIESQKGLIADYIENQADMKFCGMYCDNGQTGVNFDRPGFEKLMQDVRAGKIDCIVVKDLSRFGRNYRETGITEEMAHALISRVEVSADNSITVRLQWQDEYRMLADFLESEKGAAL